MAISSSAARTLARARAPSRLVGVDGRPTARARALVFSFAGGGVYATRAIGARFSTRRRRLRANDVIRQLCFERAFRRALAFECQVTRAHFVAAWPRLKILSCTWLTIGVVFILSPSHIFSQLRKRKLFQMQNFFSLTNLF